MALENPVGLTEMQANKLPDKEGGGVDRKRVSPYSERERSAHEQSDQALVTVRVVVHSR